MKNIKNKAIGINSILIVVSCTIISTVLHEMAHLWAAKYFHIIAELHHNYVRYQSEGSELEKMIIAAAGPLFSLIVGVAALIGSTKYLKPSLLKLCMTWFGMINVLFFMGYILIAPIAKEGDTGKVFSYFKFPIPLSITIALVCFIFMNRLFGKLSHQFVFYRNENLVHQKELKNQLFLYPIFGSIGIMTLLSFPVLTWVSLLPTIFMPMTFFKTMAEYSKRENISPDIKIGDISWILVVVTIALMLLFRYLV